MLALERQNKILELLSTDGSVSVSNLSKVLEVTEETVRRDLEKLEQKECLRRTHGGAVPLDGSTHELSLEKRKHINVEEKARLAKIASGLIVSGDTVFLDASTTTFYMAKEIKNFSNVTVITNSIRVLSELEKSDKIKVIAIGGIVSKSQSFVGAIAEKTIEENYYANKMFFSGKGITANGGLHESNEQECGIKAMMLKNSEKKYYICDSSKIGKVGFIKLADFSSIDYLVTSNLDNEEIKSKLLENEVEIILDK